MCWNKQTLFAVLFMCASSIGISQNSKIDSLLTLLVNAKDTSRVDILHSLVPKLWLNYPDSANKYAKQAMVLSNALKNTRFQATSLRLLGAVQWYKGSYDSALYYTKLSYELGVKVNDSTLIANSLNNIGFAYFELGSYSEALENLLRSLNLRLKIKQNYGLGLNLNNVGLVYSKLEDYSTARNYFKKAIEVGERLGDNDVKFDASNSLGFSYLQQNDFFEAEKYFKHALKIGKAIDNKNWHSKAYNGLGQVYYQIGLFDSARIQFRKSIYLRNEIADRKGISEIYYYLSKMFSGVNQFDSAFYFINASHRIAKQIKARDRLLENFEQYENLYLKKKQYDSALYFQSLYAELLDKKLNENSARNISDIQLRIQEEEHLKQLANKDLQLEGRIRQNYFSIAIAVLTLAFAVIVYWFYTVQKKLGQNLTLKNQEINSQKEEIGRKNAELHNLNEEKNNLIGIVAHDLKSPLNQIKGLIGVLKISPSFAQSSVAKPIQLIENSATRLTEMIGKILDVEAIESKQHNFRIEKVDFSELVQSIVGRWGIEAQRKQIQIHMATAKGVFVEVDRSYTDMIFENLLSNAIKFSPTGKNIYINTISKNDKAICEIRDEGPGFTEEDKKKLFRKYQKLSANPTRNEPSTGLGLSIVKKFVEAMKGEIWCESVERKGASFFVRFNTVKEA